MDSTLKQRLIGAAVLAALAIIFLPMLLKGPDVKAPDATEVPLSMPATPGDEYETRELPLTEPERDVPPGGVLGMAPAGSGETALMPVPDENAIAPEATPPADSSAPAVTAAPAAPAATPAEKPATATATSSAATGAGSYMVNIGSFSNLANANTLAAKLRAANLPVTADRVSLATGTAMRLRVGPYADRTAAEAARLRADGVTGAASKVVVLDAAPSAPKAGTTMAPKTTTSPVVPAAAPAAKPVATAPATAAQSAASPAAPAVDRTAKPATLATGFAVQLSAPSVEADALALRDRARALGFSSFVQRIETDAGVRYRVRVGPVADRAAAETMRDAVNSKLGTKGIVVAHP